MTHQSDANLHLAKAAEYIEAARVVLSQNFFNAACSPAVSSGIQSKDAVCILLTGTSAKSDSHSRAVNDLRDSGPHGAILAQTLGRLLSVKTTSQYSGPSVTQSDADEAVKRADRLLAGAQDVARNT